MLPKTSEYALRAAVWLARAPAETFSADRLADAIHVPRRYLHKVLQRLVRAGIVRSQPGPSGGYSLDRAVDQVTILDVVNAVGPLERIRHCPLGLTTHTDLCPLHRELDDAFAAVERTFARVTVADLLNRRGPIPPLCEVTPLAVTIQPKTA